MRRLEALDSRVNDNIDKTDSIISKLRTIDVRLFHQQSANINRNIGKDNAPGDKSSPERTRGDGESLDMRLVSLDQKVSDIDSKLVGLKNQIDSNFLPVDDINAEASEKKPISMNVLEITKAMNTEVMNHITKELDQLRTATSNVDRKLQFHINLVSENLGNVLNMVSDVHSAVVEPEEPILTIHANGTTSNSRPARQSAKTGKIDTLIRRMIPIVNVSEKMDQVWDVVVGTKSSIDDLVPKSDELLTQTQRQERAIGQIHDDLRVKANLIIENLGNVDKRLKKQEDVGAAMGYRPMEPEPDLSRLPDEADIRSDISHETITVKESTGSKEGGTRKGGVIFPSVKNKPSIGNTTFTTDVIANYKDIRGYSCVDLLNAGMRQSGVYYLQIRGTTYWFLKVFCEQDVAEGGWTVIQRRDDLGVPSENFNRDWADYKNGFGDPAKEFWLGNENIYMLTNNEDYILRIELEDFEGNKRYAQYSHFKIYSESEYYKLEIDGYEGNAGDSLNDPWYGSNNSPFSTYNRDNDRSSLNCASMLKGGWWWKSCGRGLNGLYLHDPQDLTARQGIVWFRWRGWDYTLKKASMMIKPKGPQSNT
ncbi:uncharacterized protein LOC143922644 isoform X1 [Arctopsyche grandis]|uniref:uncharacterized protein LOC143922644 isoform X1 n=1 Tax=Arctopsyche grandis TaxID=121162 RepID=UPI00406D7376